MVNAATVIILAGKVPTTTIGCKWWVRIFVFWGTLQIASSGPFLKENRIEFADSPKPYRKSGEEG
jgi:hypothetical protein